MPSIGLKRVPLARLTSRGFKHAGRRTGENLPFAANTPPPAAPALGIAEWSRRTALQATGVRSRWRGVGKLWKSDNKNFPMNKDYGKDIARAMAQAIVRLCTLKWLFFIVLPSSQAGCLMHSKSTQQNIQRGLTVEGAAPNGVGGVAYRGRRRHFLHHLAPVCQI